MCCWFTHQFCVFLLTVVTVGQTKRCSNQKAARIYTPGRPCIFSRSKISDRDHLPYTQCQYDDTAKNWWCPTSKDYCMKRQYRWCPRTQSTYGGTAPGQLCHLPFTYNGKRYRHCTKDGTPRLRAYYWCATRPNYNDSHWTRCDVKATVSFPCEFRSDGVGMNKECSLSGGKWHCRTEGGMLKMCEETDSTEAGNDPGRPCHFPFYLQGVPKFRCLKAITETDAFEWCATTKDFDGDQRWTRCKRRLTFKLEGIWLVLTVVGACLAGLILIACLIHCICNPLHYVEKRHRYRKGRNKKDCQGDKDEENYEDELEGESGLEGTAPERGVMPSAPPLIPSCSPPSYDEVLCSEVSSMRLATKVNLHQQHLHRYHNHLMKDQSTQALITAADDNHCAVNEAQAMISQSETEVNQFSWFSCNEMYIVFF